MTLQRFIYTSVLVLLMVFPAFSHSLPAFDETYSSENASKAMMMAPENKLAIDPGKTRITIKSNVRNADVWINGQYEGNTNLTINNLSPGSYYLKVQATGYAPRYFNISVRYGEDRTFYIELEKYQGQVTFSTVPHDCIISVDGKTIDSQTVTLDEGEHTCTVKKFGYREYTRTISVFRHTYQTITAELSEADFELSDFKTNKNVFNPDLNGSPGRINFSFYVTKKAVGKLTITDFNGYPVYESVLPDFSTWQQKLVWNGCSSTGTKLQDGNYTAVLEAENYRESVSFIIDRSIRIPAASITRSGSGTGTLPMAFRFPENTLALSFSAGFILTDKNSAFYGAPLSAGLSWSVFDFMELSLLGGILPGHADCSGFFSSCLKFTFQEKTEFGAFDWGFLFRAGGAGKAPFEPYGADTGNGFGGGIVLGLDFNNLYAGFSSEFTGSASTYNSKKRDSVWKNGIAAQYKSDHVTTSVYGALHSSFGKTNLLKDDRTDSKAVWTRAVESGLDFTIQPSTASYYINLRGKVLHFKNKNYFNAEAGFTVLL